ncbi:MAG: hypothetical protein ACOC1X_02110, partial [Promethearchaeota archaeon]
NSRFVYSQLGKVLQDMTKRQIWYICDQRLNGIDLSGGKKQQYISLSEMVKVFCEKLTDFYNVPYWGLVLDELYITAKARATIMDLEGIETGLNAKTFPKFKSAPFFFLICEKEDTLKSMLNELKKRGYRWGFYGIVTQGYGSTNVIRLLMEIRNRSKFYIFVAHDYDMDGLKIFFDLRRYFECESIGIHPNFMERLDFDVDINQDYSGRTGNAKKSQVKGAINMLNELFGSSKKNKTDPEIQDDLYLEYNAWIEGCIERKTELDSLLAHRLEEDLTQCKSKDLVDYLEELLNNGERVYDLNRYRVPEFLEPEEPILKLNRPKIIDETIQNIQNVAAKPINDYLSRKGLKYSEDWERVIWELLQEKNQEIDNQFQEKKIETQKLRNRFIEENRDYTDSLKAVLDTLNEQDNKINLLVEEQNEALQEFVDEQILILRQEIQDTNQYSDVRQKLNSIEESIIDSLRAPKNRAKVIKNSIADLQIIFMSIENTKYKSD